MLVLCASAMVAGAATRTHVRLLLPVEVATPGQTVMAGLEMKMDTGWHTYWINPGEAGKSTEISLNLPRGITAGPIQWPVPEKYDWATLINYVYHDEAILFIPLKVAADAPEGKVELKAGVDWLECDEECVPGRAEVRASLTIGSASKPSEHQARLEAAQASLPKPGAALQVRAWWETPGQDGKRPFFLNWKKGEGAEQFDFYPYEGDTFLIQPATEVLPVASGRAVVRKVVESFDGKWPARIAGLVVEKEASGKVVGSYTVDARVANSAEEAAAPPTRSAPPGPPAESASAPPAENVAQSAADASPAPGAGNLQLNFLEAIAYAFLGGLILNIMPCVLPVISLKILGFVNQSKEHPGRVRMLGMVYVLGVVASFTLLALLVIGVTLAGRAASWGMQFGNPYFLIGMIVLVMLVALNLFGLFEVHLGSRTLGAASELAGKEGAGGAFFNGVLATALATPCTAPFLAPALGFAVFQPPAVVLLLFVVAALGLAFPYVLLSWNPAWLRYLPKPGPWMVRFKVAMGFPMLATGIWLFSILERHYGGDGILWVGLFLVMVALAAWTYGEFVQRGRRGKGMAMAVTVAVLLGGYLVALEQGLDWRHPAYAAATAAEPATRSTTIVRAGIRWEPWSPAAVQKARAQGRPVLVDFTADWCLTCKANEKTSLNIDSVRRKLEEINAVTLIADNTLVREDIARELHKYQRAGVPLVLVYPGDPSAPPLVLPSVLTPGIVLNALDKAGHVKEASK